MTLNDNGVTNQQQITNPAGFGQLRASSILLQRYQIDLGYILARLKNSPPIGIAFTQNSRSFVAFAKDANSAP
jgi:hypothetical protein